MSSPQPHTAMVSPLARSAPSWLAASMPSASPLVMVRPALREERGELPCRGDSCGVGLREPTIASCGA